MNTKTEKGERKNEILLGFLERPALKWLSEHMPTWVTPDMMTVLGVMGATLTLFAFIMAGQGELKGNVWLLVASLGFVLNWFGDSLDGTLARFRHIERPRFGYFIDHSVDGYTAVAMFLGYGYAGIARLDVAAFGAIGYLLAMISAYLKTHVTGVFEMTTMKLGPTEIRVIAIILNLVVFFTGMSTVQLPGIAEAQTYGTVAVAVIALILFVYYASETIRVGNRLALEDAEKLAHRQKKEAKKLAKAEKKEVKKMAKSKDKDAIDLA